MIYACPFARKNVMHDVMYFDKCPVPFVEGDYLLKCFLSV